MFSSVRIFKNNLDVYYLTKCVFYFIDFVGIYITIGCADNPVWYNIDKTAYGFHCAKCHKYNLGKSGQLANIRKPIIYKAEKWGLIIKIVDGDVLFDDKVVECVKNVTKTNIGLLTEQGKFTLTKIRVLCDLFNKKDEDEKAFGLYRQIFK